jgi:hypothetical protein
MSKTKINKVLCLFALVALVAVGFNTRVIAQGLSKNSTASTNVTSQSVTQSYYADSTVDNGMLVRLKPGVKNTVEALPKDSLTSLLGIAVQQNSTSFALTQQNATKQQIFVTTTGRVNVLASDQGGPIATGDYISISAINGVAMKADGGQSEIIGKAVQPFTGNSNTLGTANITNSLGKTVQVSLGFVVVDLAIASNPLSIKSNDYVPSFLSKAATSVAAKPVSAARIYISFAIIIIASFLTANMIYSGIRSGMIAIGRNPLSKKSIIRSLIQTVIAGLIIFLGGIFGVYLLLKL